MEACALRLREIARELNFGIPVITRGWRKETAGELLQIAGKLEAPEAPVGGEGGAAAK